MLNALESQHENKSNWTSWNWFSFLFPNKDFHRRRGEGCVLFVCSALVASSIKDSIKPSHLMHRLCFIRRLLSWPFNPPCCVELKKAAIFLKIEIKWKLDKNTIRCIFLQRTIKHVLELEQFVLVESEGSNLLNGSNFTSSRIIDRNGIETIVGSCSSGIIDERFINPFWGSIHIPSPESILPNIFSSITKFFFCFLLIS